MVYFYEVYYFTGKIDKRKCCRVIVKSYGRSLKELLERVKCVALDEDGEEFSVLRVPSRLHYWVERDISAVAGFL